MVGLNESNEDVKARFDQWLSSVDPDVLLVKQLGLYTIKGIQLPEHLEYVDTYIFEKDKENNATGFHVPFEEYGHTAVEITAGNLAHGVKGPPKVPRIITIPGVWQDGETFSGN